MDLIELFVTGNFYYFVSSNYPEENTLLFKINIFK